MRFLIFTLAIILMPLIAKADYVSQYTSMSHNKMMDLMWRYNAHDFNDVNVINTYLQIQNCDLFSKYYENDFYWATIIEGFKRDTRYFANAYPNKFYITAAIPIDRYDFSKAAFLVDPAAALSNAGRIQIPFFDERILSCNSKKINQFHFPRNMKFIADKKFALTEVPVSVQDADALLARLKQNYSEELRSNRVLTLRFLITIESLESHDISSSYSEAVFGGTLDELAFFEDPQMTKLVWKKQFKVLE